MVMIVASVFIMFTILMIDQFIIDKKFYKEVEESLVADHLVHLAIMDVTAEWGEEIPKIIQGGNFISQWCGAVFLDETRRSLRIYRVFFHD